MSSYNKYLSTSRAFLKILAVPSSTDFWIFDVFTGIPSYLKLSFNCGVIVVIIVIFSKGNLNNRLHKYFVQQIDSRYYLVLIQNSLNSTLWIFILPSHKKLEL